jgi:tetratricopeptide (TPR) repeat protein
VPLGGFEPLAVSFLWLRASEQTTAGNLPAAVASYRLLTELSPRVGPAWALPAHILVFTDSEGGDPDARWRWIREGLALLERGLELNPEDPELLKTLGLAYYAAISRDEKVREIARRELGRMPEELAVQAFTRLKRVAPDDAVDAFLMDSTRLLAHALYDAGEDRRALEAYEAVLPWFTAIPDPPDRIREEVERMRRRRDELRRRTTGK